MPSGLNALIEASEQTKAKFYLSALICLGTEHGVSRQEALSLKLKDLDLDYDGIGLMYLHRTKNGMDRTSSSCHGQEKPCGNGWIILLGCVTGKRLLPTQRSTSLPISNGSPIVNFSKRHGEKHANRSGWRDSISTISDIRIVPT